MMIITEIPQICGKSVDIFSYLIYNKQKADDIFSYGGFDMLDIVTIGLDFCHPSDFYYNDTAHDWWLLIHVKTPVIYFDGEKEIRMPKNSCALFPPKLAARYCAYGGEFINSFIRFYTDEAFVEASKLPMGSPILLRSPERVEELFKMLSVEFFMPTQNRKQSIVLLMRLIILKLTESATMEELHEMERELNNLRYEIQTRPAYQWTVKEMAARLHISAGYLQAVYKKRFGVSCMHDVLTRRIELAKDHLVTTSYRISQISAICGYQSSEHFCRQFRDAVGMSPTEYRNQHAKNSTADHI